MKRKVQSILALALMLCFVLTACSKNTDPGGDNTSDTDSAQTSEDVSTEDEIKDDGSEKIITLSESWDFSIGFAPSLNPSTSPNFGSAYWGRNFYDTLLRYDDNGEIVGSLAESWDVSEDGKSYTFYLRDGVKFSDGSDLTAEAVKISMEAAVENLGEYSGSYGAIMTLCDTINIIDDHTVQFNLTTAYYGALNDLTMSVPLAIINPAAFEGQDDLIYGEVFQTATYGTGPYMYTGDYEGGTYSFVRNPYYWGEAPEVDGFRVKTIEDNDAKLLALRSGEIDAIIGTAHMSFEGYAELSAAPAFGSGISDEDSLTRYLGMNVTAAPFDDKLVRQAVAYAIDQSLLETSVFNGYETATETLFSRVLPFCDVEQTIYNTDIEKATALLEEAGWVDEDGDGVREKDGAKLEVDLNYMTSLSTIDNLALAIASQLGDVGIKVNVIAGDMMTYYAAMPTSPLLLANTYGGGFDPYTFVTNIDPAVSMDPLTVQYSSFFEDGIINELNSTSDMDRVQEIYNKLLTTIADESLLIPLFNSKEIGIWNSEIISGFSFNGDGHYTVIADFELK